MTYEGIIFDLDGTLIDSASSILCSLQAALDSAIICPLKPLDHSLIGPPLPQIMAEVIGSEQQERIPEIIGRFKEHYDTIGYLSTTPYAGITEMLMYLLDKNIDLYIATNKRLGPTLKILNHLGWRSFFQSVYSLDYFIPSATDKSGMLLRVCNDLKKDVNDMVYVGDRTEDAEAAKKNGLSFLHATWGYGKNIDSVEIDGVLISPNNIYKYA